MRDFPRADVDRPTVPDWIRNHPAPKGWTNVFTLVKSNEHLYGTETLFGDWGGQTLLLAKDGAPTPVIRSLLAKGDPRPWRHAQRQLGDCGGWRTNERLSRLAETVPGGKLYGSATANLLYDDPRWSRALPGFYSGPLHEYLRRVLQWVLESMPAVERVACLGAEAWFLTCTTLNQALAARRFSEYRAARKPVLGKVRGREISTFALYHPAARVSDDTMGQGWDSLATSSRAS